MHLDLGISRTLEIPDLVWHLDLDLDMVTGHRYNHVLHFDSLS